jgi:uncharacterized protein YgbK (DUF1537 family)
VTVDHPTPRIGLVADDLTGAADAAVQFAEAGWPVHVFLKIASSDLADTGPASVLAVATGIRAADREHASAATARAVELLSGSVDRLFLKIDSTARGSLDGQITGALTAWQVVHPDAVAVICPALPDLGRTVRDGQVLLDGRPVHRSAARVDPVTPVTQSRLDRIIDGAVRVDLDDLELSGGARLICDAETNDDLDALAAALLRLGPRAIAVGSAGLAAGTARSWPGPGVGAVHWSAVARSTRVLVAVSSLHPTALEQAARLQAIPELAPALELIMTPMWRGDGQHAAAVATGLAELVAQAWERGGFDAIVLVGGDGAGAVLDRLGVGRVLIGSSILPGTPDGRVVGGPAHGLRIVTKSGGFGAADALVTIVRRLTSDPRPPRSSGHRLVPATPQQKEFS